MRRPIYIRRAFVLTSWLLAVSPAGAQEQLSYQGLWDSVVGDPDCKPSQFPDFILVTCEKAMTLWYFTKPNHPAHPGVIKRSLFEKDGGWYAQEDGHSFASDAAQPAFKAWLAQIADLDRQARESLQGKHDETTPDSKSVPPTAPNN